MYLVSPSQVSVFLECQRKWGWRTIAKIQTIPHKSAALGTKVHSVLEGYLRDGTLPDYVKFGEAAAIATSGLHLLPTPRAGASLEKHFAFESPRTQHLGFGYQGIKDIEYSPEISDSGEAEVWDHKTTSDLKWMKTPEDLRFDPQAIIYAYDAMATHHVPVVNLNWVYYRTRGARAAQRVHLRLTSAEASPVFSRIEGIATDMASKHSLSGDVHERVRALPYNADACDSYGGCPYQYLCTDISPTERASAKMASGTLDLFKRLKDNTSPEATKEDLPPWAKETKSFAGVKSPVNPPESEQTPPPEPPKLVLEPAPKATRGKKEKATLKEVPVEALPEIPLTTPVVPPPRVEAPAASAPLSKRIAMLCINCSPVGKPFVSAEEVFTEARAAVFTKFGLADYRFGDFGKGAGYFAQCVREVLDTRTYDCVVLDSSTPEGTVGCLAFVERAENTIRGTR